MRLTSQRVFQQEPPEQTTTVGEQRRRIQREKRAQQSRALSIKVLIIAAVLTVVGGSVFVLYYSNILAVTEVRVQGAAHLTAEHLQEVAAVPIDSTLLRVDADGITARLEADPWVKQASVNREFPGTLVLVIEERPVAAQVEIVPDVASGQISNWLVSDDAVWLGTLSGPEQLAVLTSGELADLPMIKDLSRAVRPELGVKISDEGIINALSILAGFSPEMRELVATISAPDKTRTTLNLLNNVGVAFGAAEDLAAKETAIKTLLNAHAGTITYINVRVADRPTFRAVQ